MKPDDPIDAYIFGRLEEQAKKAFEEILTADTEWALMLQKRQAIVGEKNYGVMRDLRIELKIFDLKC